MIFTPLVNVNKHATTVPWEKAPQRTCSWSCLGTLLGSCWWAGCPYRSRYRHQVSVWAESPADSRSSPLPSEQHQGLHRRAQRPRCSGPWPSCFRHRSGQTQNCQDGRFGRKVLIGLSPWYQAPGPTAQHGGHTCHLHWGNHWWRQNNQVLSALLSLREGNPPVTSVIHWSPVGCSHNVSVTRSFDYFFAVSMVKFWQNGWVSWDLKSLLWYSRVLNVLQNVNWLISSNLSRTQCG